MNFCQKSYFWKKIMKFWILLQKFDFSVILLVFGGTHEGNVFDLEKLIFGSTKFWNYLQKAKSPYNLFFASEKEKNSTLVKRALFLFKNSIFFKKTQILGYFFTICEALLIVFTFKVFKDVENDFWINPIAFQIAPFTKWLQSWNSASPNASFKI